MGLKKNILEIFGVNKLVNTLVNFIETKIEIYKIQFKEEAAKAISALILMVLFAMIGLLFILFLSLFVSQLINSLLDSQYIGFIIISIFYLLCGYIVYLMRRKIREAVTDYIFTEEQEDNLSSIENESLIDDEEI